MHGSFDVHHFAVSCIGNVLRIGTAKKISLQNASAEFFKHILDINLTIPMGGFCYSRAKDCLYYKLSVPVTGNTSKEYAMYLLNFACDVLDEFVPDILAGTNASSGMNGRFNNRTLH